MKGFNNFKLSGPTKVGEFKSYSFSCFNVNTQNNINDDFSDRDKIDLSIFKKECKDLGYKPNTEKFGECVLKLSE